MLQQSDPQPAISLGRIMPRTVPAWIRFVSPALDRLLGISTIDRLYRQHELSGLPPLRFAERAISVLNLRVTGRHEHLAAEFPRRGPLIITCNHPFGAPEALVLMKLLLPVREDVKFLANSALSVVKELAPLVIATDPLRVTQANIRSIRHCDQHLAGGGVLVIFPAGRVSYRPPGERRVRDAQWNRIVGYLALRHNAGLWPVYFHGANSAVFQLIGRRWSRFRMLLLPREFLRMRGRELRVDAGKLIPPGLWRHMDESGVTGLARLLTYALPTGGEPNRACDLENDAETPVAPPENREAIRLELATLPEAQRLVEFRHFSVFHTRADQIPVLMNEIARERERVFRAHDEGSGTPRDRDDFDHFYIHLLVWDHARESLVGAYRMGPTDRLRLPGGGGLYLNRMFQFSDRFFDEMDSALELGRSFVVPEYQKSHYALHLLWRGIGQYLVSYPHYRHLYGTVSLSRRYDARAIAAICDSLITPCRHVRPNVPVQLHLHPEWTAFCKASGKLNLRTLSGCVQALDQEGKDIPVLLRHYHRLGAEFLGAGLDRHFNDTPGLLLRVDMAQVPEKILSTYMGSGARQYLAWRPGNARPRGDLVA